MKKVFHIVCFAMYAFLFSASCSKQKDEYEPVLNASSSKNLRYSMAQILGFAAIQSKEDYDKLSAALGKASANMYRNNPHLVILASLSTDMGIVYPTKGFIQKQWQELEEYDVSFWKRFDGKNFREIIDFSEKNFKDEEDLIKKNSDDWAKLKSLLSGALSDAAAKDNNDDPDSFNLKIDASSVAAFNQSMELISENVLFASLPRVKEFNSMFEFVVFEAYKKYPKRNEIIKDNLETLREFDTFAIKQIEGKSMNELLDKYRDYKISEEDTNLYKTFKETLAVRSF
jgi:hypothetical protein